MAFVLRFVNIFYLFSTSPHCPFAPLWANQTKEKKMDPRNKLQSALRDAAIPAFLVSDLHNVFWLTGFTGTYGVVIVTEEACVLISDSRYTLQAQEQARGCAVRTFASPTDAVDFLREQLETLHIDRLHFDENVVTVALHRKWAEKMPQVTLVPAEDPIGKLRAVKSDAEVTKIRAACRLADACLEHLQPLIRPGVTENELAFEVELFFRRNGATCAFTPIVVSGARSARPHGTPSDKKLERGDFVTFDIGARLDHYNSDITRTFVVGEATPRHREVYGQVLKAQQAAIAALLPGAQGKEIDGLARQILDEIGLAQYFGHGLGHGLGALVHDSGRLSQAVEQSILVGQIWTIEPGVYIDGFGGVRIEDDVLVTADGPEILTHFPKELIDL